MKCIEDYREADKKCFNALSILIPESDKATWLSLYSLLFDELTYAGDDLPYLADCHFEEQFFENITNFCATYEKLLEEIKLPVQGV